MKILLVGSLPPPYGGISVYVKRFHKRLLSVGNEVDLFEYGKLQRIKRYFRLFLIPFKKYDYIYLNNISFPIALFFCLFRLSSRTCYTSHGCLAETWGMLKVFVFGGFLKSCDEVVMVGTHLKKVFEKKGIILNGKVRIESAFVPPDPEDEIDIVANYHPEVLAFTEEREPLIIANAFQLAFYNGKDLYGLDMCIDLIAALSEKYPDIGLLFVLAVDSNKVYMRQIRQKISNFGLEKNILFMVDLQEIWPLFKRADLFVRPTCVDGYGVSVAEALYLGCPAVASDVCERAEGTIIFKNRDNKDFIGKCRDVLFQNTMIDQNH